MRNTFGEAGCNDEGPCAGGVPGLGNSPAAFDAEWPLSLLWGESGTVAGGAGPWHRRRVAAITIMDMVAFCRLTAQDEDDTLTRWKSLRTEVISERVADHGGRVIRVVGDQLMIEHGGAAYAVACAIEMQLALSEANLPLMPGARMEFRIGLHWGEVIEDGNDLFGASVNIASRLKAMANPGGIVISAAVRERLPPGLARRFEDAGPQSLRNVPGKVQAFRWRPGAARTSSGPSLTSVPAAVS